MKIERRTLAYPANDVERELLSRINLANLEMVAESPRGWLTSKRGCTEDDLALLASIVRRHRLEPHESWGGP